MSWHTSACTDWHQIILQDIAFRLVQLRDVSGSDLPWLASFLFLLVKLCTLVVEVFHFRHRLPGMDSLDICMTIQFLWLNSNHIWKPFCLKYNSFIFDDAQGLNTFFTACAFVMCSLTCVDKFLFNNNNNNNNKHKTWNRKKAHAIIKIYKYTKIRWCYQD